MATKKISELPAGAALDGTELVPLVQAGATVQSDTDAFKTFALDDFSAFGLSVGGAADAAALRTLASVYSIAQTDAGFAPISHTHTASQVTDFSTAADARITAAVGVSVQAFDADLSALAALSGTDTIYRRSGAATWSAVTIGSGLDFTAGTLSATGVTSGAITGSGLTMATARLLGRTTASSGAIEEITVSSGLSFAATTLSVDFATAAEYQAGTSTTKVLNPDKVWDAAAFVALTPGTNVSLDLSSGINFTLAMTGDYTLDNPTNAKEGQTGVIQLTQDGAGTQTLAYGNQYRFAGGTDIVLSTAASSIDLIFYVVLPGPLVFLSAQKAIAA
jgi:hypothetical protein